MESLPAAKKESQESSKNHITTAREFLGISGEDLLLLQKRIQEVEGHVRISVHPLYLSRHPRTFYTQGKETPQIEVEELLSEGFEKTVRSVANNAKSSPLLVFEEQQYLEDTKQRIINLIDANEEELTRRGFLFLPTEKSSGKLYGFAAAKAYEDSNEVPETDQSVFLEEKYNTLLEKLKSIPLRDTRDILLTRTAEDLHKLRKNAEISMAILKEINPIEEILDERRTAVLDAVVPTLGIRSVLISGGYFYTFSGQSPEEAKRLGGCAGGVTTALREKKVRVDISRFAWSPREYLQEQGIETRQTGKGTLEQREEAA